MILFEFMFQISIFTMSKLVNLVMWKFGHCHAKAVEAIAAVKLKNEGVLKGIK